MIPNDKLEAALHALLYAARLTVPPPWEHAALISLAAMAIYFLVHLIVGSGCLEREVVRSLVGALRTRSHLFMSRKEETDFQI